MSATTSINVAKAMLKLVACDALPDLMQNCTAFGLVRRDFESILAQNRDCVHFDRASGVEATVQLFVDRAEFRIPDITKVLAVPDLLALYMAPAIAALANQLDSRVMAAAAVDAERLQFSPAALADYMTVNPSKNVVACHSAYGRLRASQFEEYMTRDEAGCRAIVKGPIMRLASSKVNYDRALIGNGGFIFRSSASTHLPLSKEAVAVAFSNDDVVVSIRRLPSPLPGTGIMVENAELGNFGMQVTSEYSPTSLSADYRINILVGAARTSKSSPAVFVEAP